MILREVPPFVTVVLLVAPLIYRRHLALVSRNEESVMWTVTAYCNTCDKRVSVKATECPHCGAKFGA